MINNELKEYLSNNKLRQSVADSIIINHHDNTLAGFIITGSMPVDYIKAKFGRYSNRELEPTVENLKKVSENIMYNFCGTDLSKKGELLVSLLAKSGHLVQFCDDDPQVIMGHDLIGTNFTHDCDLLVNDSISIEVKTCANMERGFKRLQKTYYKWYDDGVSLSYGVVVSSKLFEELHISEDTDCMDIKRLLIMAIKELERYPQSGKPRGINISNYIQVVCFNSGNTRLFMPNRKQEEKDDHEYAKSWR